MKRLSLILLMSFLLVLSAKNMMAQDDPYEIVKYPFIKFDDNFLVIADTTAYIILLEKLTQIGFKGEGKVRIVHIGDSHLQADFLSGNFRRRLQTFFLGAMGGRGFIFPYKVAQTNNPLNYKVTSKGNWESCRNVERDRKCKLGLSGISVSTSDVNATISVSIDDPKLPGYDFDRLMVFHEFGDKFYEPKIQSGTIKNVTQYPDKGYTLFEFEQENTELKLSLQKKDSLQKEFNFYGFNFDSEDAGIIYHTIGINGAQYESYLRCSYFIPHLAALQPDWVIVSLGTNDAYTNIFDSLVFVENVNRIIKNIKDAAPEAAILITTPGDHNLRKSEHNSNVELVSKLLKESAMKNSISYWDFNSIMGGEGSINAWYFTGMAHTDFLHFTQKGYEYQAQLLFNAFLKTYDDYLGKQIMQKK